MGRRKPECVCEWGDTSLRVICATHARLCVMCAFDDIRPIVIRATILSVFCACGYLLPVVYSMTDI